MGEPLVEHTGQQFISTVDIVHAVRGALAVAEIKTPPNSDEGDS